MSGSETESEARPHLIVDKLRIGSINLNKSMRKPLILIVEDNHIQQRVVELFISKCGYECKIASCWSEVSALLNTTLVSDIDLILMDWHLRTAITGLDCTRYIRGLEQKGARRIPIIGMTAAVLEEDHDECIAAGMDDVMTKPFTFEQFRAKLDSWIYRDRGRQVGSFECKYG